MKNKKVFIDTDMGNDDIMAICILLLEKQIQITGISTVNGVSTGNTGYKNLRSILAFLNYQIPVKLGFETALIEKNAQFPPRDILRANNLVLLKELNIPLTETLLRKISIKKFMYEKTTNEKTTILALGPLTNIAAAIKRYGTSFTKNIDQIIMMGGGIEKGNVEPYFLAEYNIWLDPEAAAIVFSSKIPITMIGIDATQYVPATKDFTKKIKNTQPKNNEAKIIKEIIINNDNDFDAFYDPLAAYLLLDTSIITKKIQCQIHVELFGKNRGRTIISNGKQKNVTVVMSVQSKLFYEYIVNLLILSEKNKV